MYLDFYTCIFRVNAGKQHDIGQLSRQGCNSDHHVETWHTENFWNRRLKEMHKYISSIFIAGTCGLVTKQVKYWLVYDSIWFRFFFWYKSNVQEVRGINTEKTRSKYFGCLTEAVCNALMLLFSLIGLVTSPSCCHIALLFFRGR